ncbi:MAG: DUF4197 domain-containing protein [Fibrobacteria bacterium]
MLQHAKKIFLAAGIAASALLTSSCTVDDFLATATAGSGDTTLSDKVVLGLKTALKVGIDSSSLSASRINGYLANKAIKILLPQEASQALAAAAQVGAYVKPFAAELALMQSVVNVTPGLDQSAFKSNLNGSATLLTDIVNLETISDSLIFYMNRAAEYAAPLSVPIFKNAITGMSITDGLALLNSRDSTAATGYLNGKTFTPLVDAYSPIVDSTLTKVPLTQYWTQFRSTYNTLLLQYNNLLSFQTGWNSNVVVSSVPDLQVNTLKLVSYQPITTSSLGQWTTTKALGGLFYLVGEQEKEIRRDPFAYVKSLAQDISGILGEVFGEIMKMEK